MTNESTEPDFSHLPSDLRRRAERNHRLDKYEAERTANAEQSPPDDPVAEYFDGSTFVDDNVEAAAREAAAVTAARGGNVYEQREASKKAAQQAFARSANPLDNGESPSLGQLVNETTEDIALREEIRLLRKQLEARDSKIGPAEATRLTDAEYFEARRTGKLTGIRKPKWGNRE
ncbi:MAG: hypothetical protein AAFU85_13440 [Planctomycetota bacterium]